MALAALLFAALLQVPDRHREAVETGVMLPAADDVAAWTKKGAHYKRVLGILLDRQHWADALAAIEERTGLWQADAPLEIKIVFRELKEPAAGTGVRGKGEVALDVEKLAKYEKSIIDYEKLKEKVAVVVPPCRTDRIVFHELTHCFQHGKQPAWLLEGAATFVAGDGHFVAFFRSDGVKVKDVDAEYEYKYLYARGWAFLEYVKAKHGDAALKKFLSAAFRDGTPVDKAAAEATGLAWGDLKAAEREWSAKWVYNFKVKK